MQTRQTLIRSPSGYNSQRGHELRTDPTSTSISSSFRTVCAYDTPFDIKQISFSVCPTPPIMADTAPAPTPASATTGAAAPTAGATAGAPNAPGDQNAASRGLPYYEKLRRELRDTLQKKRLMDKSMVSAVPRVLVLQGPDVVTLQFCSFAARACSPVLHRLAISLLWMSALP